MKFFLLSFISIAIVNATVSAQGYQPVEITAGDNHSVARCITSTVESFGDNYSGQLGDGTLTDRNAPVSVAITDVYSVTAKGFQTVFLKTDGTIWASGWNIFGQLGDGTNTDRETPVQVTSLSNIIGIGAGVYHTLFIHEDSTVSTTGNNLTGQLGDGTIADRNIPDTIQGLDSVIQVTGGIYHSLFLKDNGKVWAVGGNFSGQLGVGTFFDNSLPLVEIPGLTDVVAIAAGESHSIFLKSDSTVWACGNNSYGQLGDGTTDNQPSPVQVSGLTDIVAISVTYSFSMFLKDDGTVYSCGLNNYGQLGNNSQTSTGANPPSQVSITEVAAIAAGGSHALYLKENGTVWANGSNSDGQLGDGGVIFGNSLVPTETLNMCNLTSLDENTSYNSVSIYPNPGNGYFSVNVKMPGYTAVVYNTMGEQVYITSLNTGRNEMNLTGISAGVYLCRLQKGSKILATEKLVIK